MRLLARADAWLARELVGARTAAAGDPRRARGFWRSGLAVVTDRRFWLQQAYLLLRVVLGWPFAILELAILAAAAECIAAPLYYRWIPQDTGRNGLNLALWKVDTLPKALALVLPGVLLLLRPGARAAARRDLGAARGRAARRATRAPAAAARGGRRALAWHAARLGRDRRRSSCLIWALTTRGTFWPVWALIPLAAVLAVHALGLAARRPPLDLARREMTQALAIHLGVVAALVPDARRRSGPRPAAATSGRRGRCSGSRARPGVHWAVVAHAPRRAARDDAGRRGRRRRRPSCAGSSATSTTARRRGSSRSA